MISKIRVVRVDIFYIISKNKSFLKSSAPKFSCVNITISPLQPTLPPLPLPSPITILGGPTVAHAFLLTRKWRRCKSSFLKIVKGVRIRMYLFDIFMFIFRKTLKIKKKKLLTKNCSLS